MIQVAESEVTRVEVFARWRGFADPPSRSEKLVLIRDGDGWRREWQPSGAVDRCPAGLLGPLVEALARPPVPELDPALFDEPERLVRRGYDFNWTDDYPDLLIELFGNAGLRIALRANSQHAYMLPLHVELRGPEGASWSAYDPRLSRALAALLPDGFQERDRLSNAGGFIDWDAALNAEEPVAAEAAAAAEPPAVAGATAPSFDIDNMWEEVERMVVANVRAEGRRDELLLHDIGIDEFRRLLAEGADPNVADEHGQTALMHAAGPPFDAERFRLLLDAGADLEARRVPGTPGRLMGDNGLHRACAGGEAAAAREWLRAGADPNALTTDGASALMLAAAWLEIVLTLLDAGAKAEPLDADGHSALDYAILVGAERVPGTRVQTIQALLDAGANLNQPDRHGVQPLGHALLELRKARLELEVDARLRETPPHWREHLNERIAVCEAVVALLRHAGGQE